LDVDFDIEVLVIVGVIEVIVFLLFVLVELGDEVVMFEFYYDFYVVVVVLVGGVWCMVVLRVFDFVVDE